MAINWKLWPWTSDDLKELREFAKTDKVGAVTVSRFLVSLDQVNKLNDYLDEDIRKLYARLAVESCPDPKHHDPRVMIVSYATFFVAGFLLATMIFIAIGK